MRGHTPGIYLPHLAESQVHHADSRYSGREHHSGRHPVRAAGHRHPYLFPGRNIHITEHHHRQLDYHGLTLFLLQGQKSLPGHPGRTPHHHRLAGRDIFPARGTEAHPLRLLGGNHHQPVRIHAGRAVLRAGPAGLFSHTLGKHFIPHTQTQKDSAPLTEIRPFHILYQEIQLGRHTLLPSGFRRLVHAFPQEPGRLRLHVPPAGKARTLHQRRSAGRMYCPAAQ